jgi:hypothetical protein
MYNGNYQRLKFIIKHLFIQFLILLIIFCLVYHYRYDWQIY